MPRQRTKIPANYGKAFPSTLRALLKETDHTQGELAEYLSETHKKTSRQAVSYYCDGSSSPDWETLVAIAGYFGVTVDYLTGNNKDIKTNDDTIALICDYTGLTERAVNELHNNIRFKQSGKIEGLPEKEKSMLEMGRMMYAHAEDELIRSRALVDHITLELMRTAEQLRYEAERAERTEALLMRTQKEAEALSGILESIKHHK